jgi:hypothetical protein
MESALAGDNTAVAATLHLLPATWLPAHAAVFHFATGTMALADGERCGLELSWRNEEVGGGQGKQQEQHPAAPFPRTVTVRLLLWSSMRPWQQLVLWCMLYGSSRPLDGCDMWCETDMRRRLAPQVTSNEFAWRLECDPVAPVPDGVLGAPTLWPAEPVVLGCSMRSAAEGATSTAPWVPATTPSWVPHLLKVC